MSEQFRKGANHTGLKSQEKLREGGWMGPKGWADKAICSTRGKAKKAPVQQLRDKALLLLSGLEESMPKAQAHRTVGKQGIKTDICPLVMRCDLSCEGSLPAFHTNTRDKAGAQSS